MKSSNECNIIPVGKRRDGGTRYWCLNHKADATAKYGRRSTQCRYAHISPPSLSEILELDIRNYDGGVALWGAVPPIYDTTRLPLEKGVHVHARKIVDGPKQIDSTYRTVSLSGIPNGRPQEREDISELDAIYYMVTSVFEYRPKYIECTLCGYSHLDKDWFSLHAHQRHLCAGCGKHFRDSEKAIGNPLARVQKRFGSTAHRMKRSKRSISIDQAEYAGGIQIWGSNPAIIWTANRAEEEGIHVHAIGDSVLDDTFSNVAIDGITLDPIMVRTLMAQNALPHIAGRIANIRCPKCSEPHFDIGAHAFTPHEQHICLKCAFEFQSQGRKRNIIGNPLIGIFERLARNAASPPRQHELGLLPETI